MPQEEEIAVLARREGTLYLGFPLPSSLTCPEEGCHTTFRCAVWTSVRRSVERHLLTNHDIRITETVNRCRACREDMGSRPTKHSCDAAPVDAPPVTVHRFKCTECPDTFPSKRGLTNHLQWHERQQQLAQCQEPALPRPATRASRRRRARLSTPSPSRTASPPSAVPDVCVSEDAFDHVPEVSDPSEPAVCVPPVPEECAPVLPDDGPIEETPEVPATPCPGPSGAAGFVGAPAVTEVVAGTPVTPSSCGSSPARELQDIVRDILDDLGDVIGSDPSGGVTDLDAVPASAEEVAGVGESEELSPSADAADDGGVAEDGDRDQPLIEPDDSTPLHEFLPGLRSILGNPCSDDDWDEFERLLELITQRVAQLVKLPPPRTVDRPRRTPNVDDPRTIQKIYRNNRRRAIRLITGQAAELCSIDPEVVGRYFRETWSVKDFDPEVTTHRSCADSEVRSDRFSRVEILARLRRFENTAPGSDRLTYRHWRDSDPSAVVLEAVFNICLKYRRVPDSWRHARTILIFKKGDPAVISNWRPIAIARTISKLYAGCWADRLKSWCMTNDVFSPCQKGFLPYDGVLEHNFVLQRRLEMARLGRSDLCVAWLDLTNAFGSIPHGAIESSLAAAGAGRVFIDVVRDMYDGLSSSIALAECVTEPIPVRAGVRQGCPLSGLLFNLVLDPVVRHVQGSGDVHRVLAYADDICLMAEDPLGLQRCIDEVAGLFQRIGLALNPSKCITMHLCGRTPVGCRPTTFLLGRQPLRALADGESGEFLGKPVGFHILPDWRSLSDLLQVGLDILRSKLAPWQRLDALRTFFFPAAHFALRMGIFSKGNWSQLDRILRPEIKKTLNVPQEACSPYLYGHRHLGGCGVPLLADDAEVLRIDSAFKLLTSKDSLVSQLASSYLLETVARRLRRDVDFHDCALFLSSEQGIDFISTSNACRNLWTDARKASGALNVRWDFQDGVPSITRGGSTIHSTHRHLVCRRLRDQLYRERGARLVGLPDQGKVPSVVALDKASNHFIYSGFAMRFADWRFVHRARLNLVPLNGARRGDDSNKACRRCGYANETLPHVLGHCMQYSDAYQRRHNNLVERIKRAAVWKYSVLRENQVVTSSSQLRPDLVISRGSECIIVDVTVPFENRPPAFAAARDAKIQKYQSLADHLRSKFRSVSIEPFVVGALGAWDPANDQLLKRICGRRYGQLMKKLCVSDTIKWSRDIFIQHLTGTRQY